MKVLLIALLAAISYAQTDFLTLEAYITNDEAGLHSTCQSVATAFKGELLECNLERIEERRTLQEEEGESIFLDVLVPEANKVIDALESDSYSIPNVVLRMPRYGSIRRYLDSPYIGDDVSGSCQGWCDSGSRPSSTYCDWPNCGKCAACYPTKAPTLEPTNDPSTNPTKEPTNMPSLHPTNAPSANPTINPTDMPSTNPTKAPTANPSIHPTNMPSTNPTAYPTKSPEVPSKSPTDNPSTDPTLGPTNPPSIHPTYMPTGHPTVEPTSGMCDKWCPGKSKTWYDACGRIGNGYWRCMGCTECGQLTDEPSAHPTLDPTNHPSDGPTEPVPTNAPTIDPTMNPTRQCDCKWWCHNYDSRNGGDNPWSQRCKWDNCCGCSNCFPCSAHSECTHEDDLNRNFCKRRRGKGFCTTCDECKECANGIDDSCGPSCGTTTRGKTCN